MDFKGLGKALVISVIVLVAICIGIGWLIGRFAYKPNTNDIIYKEYWVSDTTYLPDNRIMIMQHKEFKKIQ